MIKEITMESVFQAGFKAAWSYWLANDLVGAPGEPNLDEQIGASPDYWEQRRETWHAYVKELGEQR